MYASVLLFVLINNVKNTQQISSVVVKLIIIVRHHSNGADRLFAIGQLDYGEDYPTLITTSPLFIDIDPPPPPPVKIFSYLFELLMQKTNYCSGLFL